MDEQRISKDSSKLLETFPTDIKFENLSYSVVNIKETKQILHTLCGNFRSGELTGILGPSGSGKTTLIKILVGYINTETTGTIEINNKPRQMRDFHKSSVFIMQEDLFQPFLTVHEAMTISTTLKLGNSLDFQKKSTIVNDILQMLSLEDCHETRVEHLSGGQRKRLSIALELVDNPPVIFLDEPTSGLDSVSAQQCVKILRTLANQGKTIICTIHQPSVAIFETFDQTYFMAEGRCVYNGSPENMISFLESVKLPCALDYSPSEYVIEIVQIQPECISMLSNAIENGKLNQRSSSSSITLHKESSNDSLIDNLNLLVPKNFSRSFWAQFSILLKRMWLQQLRNKTSLSLIIVHYIIASIIIGLVFYGHGNNAKFLIRNFTYFLVLIIFFIYNFSMCWVLLMPTEMKIIKREYFNRWYSVKPYFFALSLKNLPVLMIMGAEVVAVTYVLSNQPLELMRFFWFYIINITLAIISQSYGMIIGCIFNVKNGAVIGASSICAFVSLAIHGLGYRGKTLLFWRIVIYTSYIRFGLVAICLAILLDRPLLDCNEIFCATADTKLFLRDFGVLEEHYGVQIIGLVFYLILYVVLAYFTFKFRLNKVFSTKVVPYVHKILKCGK